MIEVRTRANTVEHITVVSNKPFEETRSAFESALGRFDDNIYVDLDAGNIDSAQAGLEDLPPLVIAGSRDHGKLLLTVGQHVRAIQYDCGNALTATRMTRHQLSAAMYAPIRVLLREDAAGQVAFEYDRPSTVFGQFGDPAVDAVARDLDILVESKLRDAAS
jgi:hypothetical protein